MPMVTYKPLHNEVPIGSGLANNVSGAPLARVINTGATTVLHFLYANSTEYANLTVIAGTEVIVKKFQTDLLQGNNMIAIDVAYQY